MTTTESEATSVVPTRSAAEAELSAYFGTPQPNNGDIATTDPAAAFIREAADLAVALFARQFGIVEPPADLRGHLAQSSAAFSRPASDESEQLAEYAQKQESVETLEKQHLARKAVTLAALKDGQGAVLDAGSTNLATWKGFSAEIREHKTLLSFRTNSNQILREWERSESPAVRETHVSILGSVLDRAHQAFFGGNTNDLLKTEVFRPAAVFIGTSGVKFDPTDGILFSYHAGEPERAFKQLLFKCKTDYRFILATASKIGFSGAHAFDVLSVPDLDKTARLFLITTAPHVPDNQCDERAMSEFYRIQQQFNHAKSVFYSDTMQQRLRRERMTIEWIILDPITGEQLASTPEDGVSRPSEAELVPSTINE